jgi:hypothetical protein
MDAEQISLSEEKLGSNFRIPYPPFLPTADLYPSVWLSELRVIEVPWIYGKLDAENFPEIFP